MSGVAAARAVALAALTNIEKNKAYSGLTLKQAKKQPLSPRDERLVWRLVYGVITYRLGIDYILNQFCRRKIDKLSPTLRNILRLACYQLVYLDRIPDFAAVNEAVDMARRSAGKGMAGFVNGVLRNILRNREELFAGLTKNTREYISIFHSHPQWLVDQWIQRWGVDFTSELCEANNKPAPLTIRVNTDKITVDDYLALAAKKDLEGRRGRYCPDALVFAPESPFSQLPGFDEGLFIVQGEASMLPALVLDVNPGDTVLDMCSAPGGKTAQLAQRTDSVTAWDLYPSRLKLLRQNAARLGLKNIATFAGDAAKIDTDVRYDRVLLDAPCSGFGVLRKKPEIKWTRDIADIQELQQLQLQLLHKGCNLLKPGGYLVYSTCTLIEQENEGVVGEILNQRADIQAVSINLPELANAGEVTTFPHIHNLDGFFIAKLTKVV